MGGPQGLGVQADVIREAGAEGMRWERWDAWPEGDPRWRVRVIDTSELPVEQVVDALTTWIADERELLRSGSHPLAGTELQRLDSQGDTRTPSVADDR